MLYLDSPASVGFSYSTNKSFYDLLNDELTARDNLVFLRGWFTKFPQYKDNDFFITGEDYAGHFVPQLAHLILQGKTKINLKGIAISREYRIGTPSKICNKVAIQVSKEIGADVVDLSYIMDDVCVEPEQQLQGEKTWDAYLERETYTYLNRKDVQKALHAELIGIGNWSTCSGYDCLALEFIKKITWLQLYAWKFRNH